jgi:predicted metal-binding protein
MFGDIEPAADLPALVTFAQLYAASADGQTRLVERPKSLRPKLLGRIPAIPGLGG